jgi:hypothetical protein
MKLLARALLVLLTFFALKPSQAEAQYPLHHGHFVGNVYVGWGFYPIIGGNWGWAYYGYPAWQPYGYSYWPYWGYAPRYASFGAISYSPSTERVGLAWGRGDGWSARAAANDFCAVSDCAPVVWVQGGCAAVVKGEGVDQLFWAYHTTKLGAKRYAMNACQNQGATNCELGAWVCSW